MKCSIEIAPVRITTFCGTVTGSKGVVGPCLFRDCREGKIIAGTFTPRVLGKTVYSGTATSALAETLGTITSRNATGELGGTGYPVTKGAKATEVRLAATRRGKDKSSCRSESKDGGRRTAFIKFFPTSTPGCATVIIVCARLVTESGGFCKKGVPIAAFGRVTSRL